MSVLRKVFTAAALSLALALPAQQAQAFCCGFFDGWGGGGMSFSMGVHARGYGLGSPYWGYPWYGYGHPAYGYPYYPAAVPVLTARAEPPAAETESR